MLKLKVLANVFIATLSLGAISMSHAQTPAKVSSAGAAFPEKSVRLIVPFPAGGTVDGVARTLGPEIAKEIKQSVIIENRGGAGGSIGAGIAARSDPDGYTLLLVLDTHALNPLVYKNLPYDTDKDFSPISLIARAPMMAVANLNFAPNNVSELIKYAKDHPKKVNFASVGPGSSGHLTGELFNQMANVSMTHIPYRGGAPLMTDLMGGQVEMTWGTVPYVQALVKAGKIKPLGQAGAARSAVFPDVPTVSEQGLPGLEAYGWVGILAPAGTPDDLIRFWHKALSQVMKQPKVAERFKSEGFDIIMNSPAEFKTFVSDEQGKWSKLMTDRNITLN